jgi:hypothetical protein
MSTDQPGKTPEGGRESSREGRADIADAEEPNGSGAGTDAARGQTDEMARTGGDASAENRRSTPFEPATSSQGSRTGSALGSQSDRTGMADGQPTGSSQGLGIEERPDGGPLRPSK